MTGRMYAVMGLGAFLLLACQNSLTGRAALEPALSRTLASRSTNLVGVWRITQFCTLSSVWH